MPIPSNQRRDYFRDYMRKRRAAAAVKPDDVKPPDPSRRCVFCGKPQAHLWGTGTGTRTLICADCATEAVRALQAATAREDSPRAERSAPKPKSKAKPAPSPSRPAEPTKKQWDERDELASRREHAENCLRALVYRVPRHRHDGLRKDDVRETIVAAFMRRYGLIKDIFDIDQGITRRPVRVVLGDLHDDRAPAELKDLHKAAYIALKEMDRPRAKGGIIAAKATTYADMERQRAERSARGKAAAAKRKAKR
jgi:hypothetical protein